MTGSSATQSVNVDVSAVEKLELVVDTNGVTDYDHADWANARVTGCVVYDGPIVISDASIMNNGNIFHGNWRSNNPNIPAVLITTQQPVIIENSTIASRGDGIAFHRRDGGDTYHTKVTVRHNYIYGMNPNTDGVEMGTAVTFFSPDNLIVENNRIANMGGVRVNSFSPPAAGNVVRVRYNRATNINGRVSSGVGTYRTSLAAMGNDAPAVPSGGFVAAQFFQLLNTPGKAGVEVAWNKVTNELFRSRVEDNINIYRSSGVSGNPVSIHDNLISGAYPIDGTSDYYGGGILLGDTYCKDPVRSAFQEAYNNTVLETTNYGVGIYDGTQMSIRNNNILGRGTIDTDNYTDNLGNTDTQSADHGIYVRNYCGTNSASTNTANNNSVGWAKPGNDPSRQDVAVTPGAGTESGNTSPAAITQTMIENAATAWDSSASANGITVGP